MERQVRLLIFFRRIEEIGQLAFAYPGGPPDGGHAGGDRKAVLERLDQHGVAANGEAVEPSAAFDQQETILAIRPDRVSQDERSGGAQPGCTGCLAALDVDSIK